MEKHFDYLVIGAGMSGMAAAIRLGMFEKDVAVFESHRSLGGLNSFYQRVKKNTLGQREGIRRFDVGLHALTNFAPKKKRRLPLNKMLNQLRIPYDDLQLSEQTCSSVVFPEHKLSFSNDFDFFQQQVRELFPNSAEGFRTLVEKIRADQATDLNRDYESTLKILNGLIPDQELIEMILCPVQYYGCAWERDMDWPQFVIMFQSLFFEGLARPEGGVRRLISLLQNKIKNLGIPLFMGEGIKTISKEDPAGPFRVETVKGRIITAGKIFSSIGHPETYGLMEQVKPLQQPKTGKMSFVEAIFVYPKKIQRPIIEETIVFFNNQKRFIYEQAKDLFDATSGVLCLPDNYHLEETEGEGTIRLTFRANYDQWKQLNADHYQQAKKEIEQAARTIIAQYLNGFNEEPIYTDVFTPLTIQKYTKHFGGTVYGSPDKSRDGRTEFENLYLIGTDQGYLGIVGAMLSGISMANLHGLQSELA